MDILKGRWRKATDINRKNAIFELLIDERIILDVGFSDDNIFEVAFHVPMANAIISWDHLELKIKEGKFMADQDR